MGILYGLGLKDRSRVVGLTGGIATGKTTVSAYLASHDGLTILDADLYAREAVSPGSQIMGWIAPSSLKSCFRMLLKNSGLNR
jgi:dephospho-CoA kinase